MFVQLWSVVTILKINHNAYIKNIEVNGGGVSGGSRPFGIHRASGEAAGSSGSFCTVSTQQRGHFLDSRPVLTPNNKDMFRAIDATPTSFDTQILGSSRSIPRVSSTTCVLSGSFMGGSVVRHACIQFHSTSAWRIYRRIEELTLAMMALLRYCYC
jgi:hypothetical protein